MIKKILLKIIPLEIQIKIKSVLRSISNNKVFRIIRARKIKSELMVIFMKSKNVAGTDSKSIHNKVIELFCLTSGIGLDEISKKLPNDSILIVDRSKYFPKLQTSTQEIADEIKEKGFFLIESAIPKDICEAVVEYASSVASYPRAMHGAAPIEKSLPIPPYKSARYDFSPDPKLIYSNPVLQELIFDPFIFDVAQKYLNGLPYLDPVELWWYFPYGKRDQNWAEDYHFDLDSLRWLKFFINFEDIKIENGPHCFIEGSHKGGAITNSVLSKGYARVSEEEVLRGTKNTKEHIFIAPAGSLLIEDTRGFHKGLTPQSGRRLLFSIQYSNVYLGHHVRDKISALSNITDVMKQRCSESPNSYYGHLSDRFSV